MAKLLRYGYLKREWVPLWLMRFALRVVFKECHMRANDSHRIIAWNAEE
jgi:hypothetical protein